MVQATDFADGHDFAQFPWLDRPPVRCIFGEGEVRSGAVVIANVARQDVTQVALAEDDDVVETVAPDRPERSANGFCHGLRAAVRTSWIPMPFTR
jgi:hypothetical protein